MIGGPLASGPGRLHVLTDETIQSRFSHLELARLAARGGADVVQLRDKRELAPRIRIERCRSVVEILASRGVRLIVNDHVEVAAAVGASGVHLGRTDEDPRHARRRLGARALIGATANSVEEALALGDLPLDYLGVGPVFGTRSKRSPAPELGLAGLADIVAVARVPVIAIGNLTPERVSEVLHGGAFGVAVLSDVALAEDPAHRVACFREAIEEELERGNSTATAG